MEWAGGEKESITMDVALEHTAWYLDFYGSVVRVKVIKPAQGDRYEVAVHV